MQVTYLLGLVLAVTGALAAPGGKAPPKAPPKPAPPSGNQVAAISCSSGDPYCCTASTGGTDDSKGGGNANGFTCSKLVGACNSIAVCCNNQAQQGASASQTCSAFGTTKVIFI
ncbi:hypothetical protein G7Z17_g1360 [Cylindrodendrum hubeiense]|uniref:Hydrophobin n=1 Tax=Cylindrodendrum hubeiense TaxID=595255 RepID=A0A9P5HL03_9HYPO|nr:hypothetical protein G7Z17_g1360 [Cylindrodendrum hubeiense]